MPFNISPVMNDFEFEQYRLHREAEGKLISELSRREGVSLSEGIGIYLQNPQMESRIFTTTLHSLDDVNNLIANVLKDYFA